MERSDVDATRICIVGAGPAGLAMARALKAQGLGYDQYERHSDVGGIWGPNNLGSPMYRSAHFISSRKTGFPMPQSFPDYPSNHQILAYTRSFADAYGLREALQFDTTVEQVESYDGGWRVRIRDGADCRAEYRYGAVICANGVNWHPRLPRHPGKFNGEIRHSVRYHDAQEFHGKRVLIIGLGNSGADIACDAAANADAAWISVPRGYHFIPKHFFGIPVDELVESGPQLPLWLKRPVFSALLRFVLGDLSRLGLPKPDHKLFESHPLLNTQLLHYLQHGDIRAKGDVDCFDGDDVVFTDGSRERVDLVLYATGYDMRIPYVPEEYFDWAGGHPQLYLTAFNRRHRNLFGIGFLETNSSAYTLFDRIAVMVANYLADQHRAPKRAARMDQLVANDRPDLCGGIRFIGSDRYKAYIEIQAYKHYLEKLRRSMGWCGLKPGCFEALRDDVTAIA